jgi:predicted dehydrogenase
MKVIQIGYGQWGEILAKAIDSDDNLDLVGIHTRTPIDNALYYKNLDAALDNSLIKGAIVTTPLVDRHTIIKQCLDAGKHVLAEKPLAETVSLAQSLLKMAQDRNLTLYTNYTHAHSQLVSLLKSTISGQDINSIKITMTQTSQVFDNENVDTLIFSHILSILFNLCPSQLRSLSKNSIVLHDKYDIILRTPSLYLEASIRSPKYKRVIEVETDSQNIYVDFSNDGFMSECHNGLVMPRKIMNQSSNLKHVFHAFKSACKFGTPANNEQAIAVQQALDRL